MLKVLIEHDQLLTNFGKDQLDEDIINDAEEFLVRVVASKKIKQCSAFDDLRTKMYFDSRSNRIIELPCTSRAIRQNIKRAFLQTRLWINAPYLNQLEFSDPTDFGFQLNLNTLSFDPIMFDGYQVPPNVPEPCYTCTTCTKKSCPCRTAESGCTDFCGCANHGCKNPHSISKVPNAEAD